MVCSELFEARLPGRSQLRGFRAQDGRLASAVGVFVDRVMFAVLRGSEGTRLGSKLGKQYSTTLNQNARQNRNRMDFVLRAPVGVI